jgi:DNA invertase Pin-like site-specific DNA recombinase
VRVAVYVRVSTDRQVEEGYGLAVQEQQCRGWANTHGHRVVAVCSDEGVSGGNGVEDRVGLPLALEVLRDGRAEGMLVARLDRLARALTVQEAILAKVWAFGGALFTADSSEVLRDDPDDPMRTAMRQMAGVFAELDRKLIAKRLRDGRRAKAERGGFAYGSPPFGYRAEDGALMPDNEEQRVLARIVELRGTGLSLRAMCEVLTEDGCAPKHGGTWHPYTLSKILSRIAQ